MLRRTFIATLTMVSLGMMAVAAPAQVTLEHKLADGLKSQATVEVKVKQVLSIAGMEFNTGSEQSMRIQSEHGARAANGTIRIKQKISEMKASLILPGGVELDFDSNNADAPAPGTPFDMFLEILKATAKSSWTTVYDKDNRVVTIEGREDAIKDLDPTVQQMVAKQFDAEYLKEQANVELDRLPSTPVSKGDSWSRTSVARLEGGQNLEFDTEYKYLGTVEQGGKQLDKIDVNVTSVGYSVDEDAPSQLKVNESDLKVDSSEGHILFDRNEGRVLESHSKIRIVGEIKFSANGMDLPGKLDLMMQQKTSVK